ncbi:MAG: four-carbon acid sugar kinase family protein [Neorhizobium sp.]|nr:four-carbon acid sugar kinase family protein [Neorhizobium sp.]
MQVLIIADDLTGALDSTVAFANRGLRSVVLRHPAAMRGFDFASVDVVAVSTGSRDGSTEAACAAVAEVVEALRGLRPSPLSKTVVFKKVDSRLKGHVGAETAALAEGLDLKRLLVAPAIPDMGRVVRGGAVIGMGVPEPISIAACFAGHDLHIEAPDVDSDSDFDGLWAGDEGMMLVGARGLAAALARHLAPEGKRHVPISLPAPALFAIGSRDPITETQVTALATDRRVVTVIAENGRFFAPLSPGCGVTLAKLTAGAQPAGADLAGHLFAEGVCAAIEMQVPATLLGCGGETANALLERFSVERLDVIAEILPGVPLSRGTICGRTVNIITKSGGFGDADTLTRLAGMVESGHRVQSAGAADKRHDTAPVETEDRP